MNVKRKKKKIKKTQFWVSDNTVDKLKLHNRISTFHELSIFLMKECVKSNNFRFIQSDKVKFLTAWKNYLESFHQKNLEFDEVIDIVASEMIDKVFWIYRDNPKRIINKRQKEFLKFKIKKHFKQVINDIK